MVLTRLQLLNQLNLINSINLKPGVYFLIHSVDAFLNCYLLNNFPKIKPNNILTNKRICQNCASKKNKTKNSGIKQKKK